MSDHAGYSGVSDRGAAGADGSLRRVVAVRDARGRREHERVVDRWAERNPGTVDRSDAAIAHERLKLVRRSIKRYGEP